MNYRNIIRVILFIPIYLSCGDFVSVAGSSSSGHVTYATAGSPVFDLLIALALQVRVPVGIELGENQTLLCNQVRAFKITEKTPYEAFSEVVRETGYVVEEHDGVLLVIAGDLTTKQRDLINHTYRLFPGGENTMAGFGAQLTGWMQMEAEGAPSFAASVVRSHSSEQVKLADLKSSNTAEIANNIVKLGSKGLWIIKKTPFGPDGTTDEEVRIYSYVDDLQSLKQMRCRD